MSGRPLGQRCFDILSVLASRQCANTAHLCFATGTRVQGVELRRYAERGLVNIHPGHVWSITQAGRDWLAEWERLSKLAQDFTAT